MLIDFLLNLSADAQSDMNVQSTRTSDNTLAVDGSENNLRLKRSQGLNFNSSYVTKFRRRSWLISFFLTNHSNAACFERHTRAKYSLLVC